MAAPPRPRAVLVSVGAGILGAVPVERVLLAEPRGFCAGVEKAIKALAWMVAIFEPPVYCYHEIVHNQRVVEAFRDLGRGLRRRRGRGARRARPLMLERARHRPRGGRGGRGPGPAWSSTPSARS